MRRNIPSPQREINDLEPPACFYYALKSVNLTIPPDIPFPHANKAADFHGYTDNDSLSTRTGGFFMITRRGMLHRKHSLPYWKRNTLGSRGTYLRAL